MYKPIMAFLLKKHYSQFNVHTHTQTKVPNFFFLKKKIRKRIVKNISQNNLSSEIWIIEPNNKTIQFYLNVRINC